MHVECVRLLRCVMIPYVAFSMYRGGGDNDEEDEESAVVVVALSD